MPTITQNGISLNFGCESTFTTNPKNPQKHTLIHQVIHQVIHVWYT